VGLTMNHPPLFSLFSGLDLPLELRLLLLLLLRLLLLLLVLPLQLHLAGFPVGNLYCDERCWRIQGFDFELNLVDSPEHQICLLACCCSMLVVSMVQIEEDFGEDWVNCLNSHWFPHVVHFLVFIAFWSPTSSCRPQLIPLLFSSSLSSFFFS